MRLATLCSLAFALASAVMAQMTPGVVVRYGEPFPIVTDFNGDGLDDLVQEKNVLLSNGTGFSDSRDLGLRALEKVIGVLDVNGDHIPDLLTAETAPVVPPSVDPTGVSSGPHYRLYIGDTSRKYGKSIDITAAAGPPPYIADVDGDGKDDLLIMSYVRPDGIRATAMDVTVLRSNGDGTFERLAPFRIPPDPQTDTSRLLVGDLNHDGLPDIVMRTPYDLVILRGTGGGHFAVENRYMPENMQYGWWSTFLGDIDGDSNLDVVIVGWRRVRVFFGDGHGNFPRMATTTIPKLHDAVMPPNFPVAASDDLNQPRDIALGHFTRSDQMQIAAGTVEGDFVVISWENGALREVSRTQTEFWHLDIRSGNFRSSSISDLYVMGTLIWGDMYPKPHVFNGYNDVSANAQTPARLPSRGRASHPIVPASQVAMQMQFSGDCIDQPAGNWMFSRDGVFGQAQRGDAKIEAIFDAPHIYMRFTAPFAKEPVQAVLDEANGVYSGMADVLTSCGWKKMTVTANLQ